MRGTARMSTDGTDNHTRIGMTRAPSHRSKDFEWLSARSLPTRICPKWTSIRSDANSTRSADVEDRLGAKDAAYIRRTIMFQRALDVAARLVIASSRSKAGWLLGTAALAYAKSIENMELGHNVSHGQWDWMNDPEIHSSTWEWDMLGLSSQWRYSHNYRHHVFSNVLGMDDDIGFGIMRVTRDQPWQPALPVAAAAKHLAGSDLRMGYRPARPALGADGSTTTGEGRAKRAMLPRSPAR